MSGRGFSRATSFAVSCRVRGHNRVGRAYDLTHAGCLLDLGNGLIAAGDHVALRFACGVRLHGRVTLVHGRILRVEFEQPLHDAIYEHLTRSEEARSARASACSYGVPNRARRLG